MNALAPNINSSYSKDNSITNTCGNGKPDESPSSSSQSYQYKAGKYTEKQKKYTKSTHDISSRSTNSKKTTVVGTRSKDNRDSKETTKNSNKRYLTPETINSKKLKHDTKSTKSSSTKHQLTTSPKKQNPSISGSYNIKQHRDNREIMTKKYIIKKGKESQKHGGTIKKESLSTTKSLKKIYKSKEKDCNTIKAKCLAPLKSVVHTCTERHDFHDKPVPKFQDTKHIGDLRNKLKRKHQPYLNTKRENLIITVPNDESNEANEQPKIDCNPPKIKQDTRKFKKIKLVLNLTYERCSDSSESDNNSGENEYPLSNVDLSFLDDFNVDDIVDCLKTPEKKDKPHVNAPFKTADKMVVTPDNNNMRKVSESYQLADGVNESHHAENKLYETKKETKTEVAVNAKGCNENEDQTKVVENKRENEKVFELLDFIKSSIKKDILTSDKVVVEDDSSVTMEEISKSECKINCTDQNVIATAEAITIKATEKGSASSDIPKSLNSSNGKPTTSKNIVVIQPAKLNTIIKHETIIISDSEDEQGSLIVEVDSAKSIKCKPNTNANKKLEAIHTIDFIDLSTCSIETTVVSSSKHDSCPLANKKLCDNIYPQSDNPETLCNLQSDCARAASENKEIITNSAVKNTQNSCSIQSDGANSALENKEIITNSEVENTKTLCSIKSDCANSALDNKVIITNSAVENTKKLRSIKSDCANSALENKEIITNSEVKYTEKLSLLQSDFAKSALDNKELIRNSEVKSTQNDKKDVDNHSSLQHDKSEANMDNKESIPIGNEKKPNVENEANRSNIGNKSCKNTTLGNNDTEAITEKVPSLENDKTELKHTTLENKKNISGVQNKQKNSITNQTKEVAKVTANIAKKRRRNPPPPQKGGGIVGSKTLAMNLHNRLFDYFGVEYTISNLLRQGRFSKVLKCKNAHGHSYALKLMHKDPNLPLIPYNVKGEMLKSLQRDIPEDNFHCVFFIDCFPIMGHWCFLMEFYPSNLQLALSSNKKCFHIDDIQKLSRQLVSAVVVLRNNNIAHLAIRPEHILMNSTNDKLKLAGFDEAQYIDDITIRPNYGTPSYRPPEVLLGYPSFHKVDVWAVACIMYEMATKRKLFSGCYNNDILYKQQCMFGNIPYDMLFYSQFKDFHYVGQYFLRKQADAKASTTIKKFNTSSLPSATIYNLYNKTWNNKRTKAEKTEDFKKLSMFCELLKEMLTLHPEARLPIEFVYTSQFLYESFDSNLWR